jgi:putative ABC transport system substrate-binding protein
MRRREFITLLSGVVVGWPLAARAERPPFVVGMTSILAPDLAPKRLQLLQQVVPSLARVALLFNPNNASNIISRDEIETATRDLGISLVQVEASTVSDLDTKLGHIEPASRRANGDWRLIPHFADAQDYRLS